MLVRSIFTVRVAVTLPIAWYAETVALALELIVVAEARTSGGWKGILKKMSVMLINSVGLISLNG